MYSLAGARDRLLAVSRSFIVFLFLCTCVPALGQNPYTDTSGDPDAVLLFDQQADLDAFVNANGKYTSSNIGITLNGNNATDPLTDLSNLSDLTDINGRLTIIGWGTDEQAATTGDPLSAFGALTLLNNLEIGDFDVNNLGVTAVSAPLLTIVDVRAQIRNCNNLVTISFPELTQVDNTLIIDTLRNVETLSFPKLTTVGRTLQLEELDKVTNLDGFGALSSISTNLSLLRLPALTSVTGLGATVPGGRPRYNLKRFILRGSPLIEDISSILADVQLGFKVVNNAALTTIGTGFAPRNGRLDELLIQNCPELTSIAGLLQGSSPVAVVKYEVLENDALTDLGTAPLNVSERIEIIENTVVTALPDFSPTTNLAGTLLVGANPALTTIGSLNNVRFVAGDVNFSLNPSLPSLTGLELLEQVGALTISFNAQLTTLDPLASLTTILNSLTVVSNSQLEDCCALPCQTTVSGQPIDGNNGAVTFGSNKSGGSCENKQAVQEACTDCGATPVDWAHFTGDRQGRHGAQLHWATYGEQDNAGFAVERSVDGQPFTQIAWVAGAGDSRQQRDYGYLDTAAPAATLYYRLRQVDHDGTEDYSPIVALAGTTAMEAVSCYPNPPVGGRTQLLLPPTWNAERITLLLADALGRAYHPQWTRTGQRIDLEVGELPTGPYVLLVADGARRQQVRLVVR
ncbi:hypothetical protein LEM8419_00119 [Neolewinella maritima]|uniref:T9SS type A sorting domain-containing protein n=1 Tax=Neolewinella maritima TaxID=1383882 RepID=A0ABM9AVW0_9BACT|nr:hypothetical protein [Neolewinella maritima]CAH0998778.1 hypothetical protein LEM8419_00119 [Neolewinella maritima]